MFFKNIPINKSCKTTTPENFNKKEILEILCLNKGIAINPPNVPPTSVNTNNVISEIRFLLATANALSSPKIKKLRLLITKK